MSAAVAGRAGRHTMLSAGFTDPAFREVSLIAREVAGLVFPPNREPSAEAGMRRAMSTLRLTSPRALLDAIQLPGDARDALLAELTVGESYFFRDEPQVRWVLGEILAAGATPSTLRLWSAGCASGEEPYTLAILLRELNAVRRAEIVATDIALPRLAAARRGRYTRWALRGASDERIARWFTRDGAAYVLDERIREAVEFRRLNLTVDEYPAAGAGIDLILCRNVMIYFDLATAGRIAERLLAALAPDGWLLLGASDPPLAHLVACEMVMTQWGVAYRRADRIGGDARAKFVYTWPAPHHEVEPPVQEPPAPAIARAAVPQSTSLPAPLPNHIDATDILSAYHAAEYAGTEILATTYLASHAAEPAALRVWIAYVRAVANQGRLADAGELCSRALELHAMSPELHYLHATLLGEANWMTDAVSAARRAIYLDRRFTMGHLLLGDFLMRQGDAAGARRALENASGLLTHADATQPVPASDGVPAVRLLQIAQSRLANLAEGARA